MKFKNLKLLLVLAASLSLFACVPDRHKMIKEREPQKEVKLEELKDTLGADVKSAKITYCHFKYLNKHEATHIGDRLLGEEYTQGYLTIRTNDSKRAGMYAFIMLSGASDIAKGCTIELSIDASNMPKVKTYTFTVGETESLFREIKLGITTPDWTDPKANVNAWKVVIKSPQGEVLATKRSWLWSIQEERDTEIF